MKFVNLLKHSRIVKDILKRIASEESNHAQLAWTTVKWAINRFPELRSFFEETFKAQLNRPTMTSIDLLIDYCNDCEQDSALHDHGLLVERDQLNVETFGIRDAIKPVVQNEIENVKNDFQTDFKHSLFKILIHSNLYFYIKLLNSFLM